MHDLVWEFGIPVIQLLMCRWRNNQIRFLTTFLLTESVVEIILAAVNVWGSENSYLYAWLGAALLHHAMCCFLLSNLYNIVRRRGLPWRQSVIPVYALAAIAAGIGIWFAKYSLGFLVEPSLRAVFPLDHAISFSIGCMLAMLPFYQLAISSSLPRPVYLVMIGFAVYEIAYAGLLGVFIPRQHMSFPHAIDTVFLLSLFVWSVALRSDDPLVVKERSPLTP